MLFIINNLKYETEKNGISVRKSEERCNNLYWIFRFQNS